MSLNEGYVALVLAAGRSTRFGGNKLEAQLGENGPLVLSKSVSLASRAPVTKVVVVKQPSTLFCSETGSESSVPVDVLDFESGAMSESLKTGVASAGSCQGVFVFLGDMPAIDESVASTLANRLGDGYAAVPVRAGKQGHPVLLSRRALEDVRMLKGDRGAKALLKAHGDAVVTVEWPNDSIFMDIDEPTDLARMINSG